MKAGPNHRQAARSSADLHETPEVAVRALLYREQLPARLWDPACGPGAIVEVLRLYGRDCCGSDIVKHGDFHKGDFFRARSAPAGVEAIIINPPYKQAAPFVEHALTLVPTVYALLRLNWYAAVRPRYPGIYDRLHRIRVFAPRLPLMHRADWQGKKASSQFDHAWFVFEARPPTHGVVIDRINWRTL